MTSTWAGDRELKEDIALVMCRGDLARGYLIVRARSLPDVPFVFDTVDLHFLRGSVWPSWRGGADTRLAVLGAEGARARRSSARWT